MIENQNISAMPGGQNLSPQPSTMKKVYIIIALMAVTSVGLLWLNSKNSEKMAARNETGQTNRKIGSLPTGFPQDFPVDVTARLNIDGEQKGLNGEMLLRFTSNLTVEQAFVAYSDYFTKHNWQILSKIDQIVGKSLTAKSPVGDILSLNFTPAANNKILVNASLAKAQ